MLRYISVLEVKMSINFSTASQVTEESIYEGGVY